MQQKVNIRLHCYFCCKPVSSKIPYETVVRALIICPECIEKNRIIIPESEDEIEELKIND